MAINDNTTVPFPLYITPFAVGHLTLGLIGICGNLSILSAAYRSSTLRATRCTFIMCCLAAADLFTCAMFVEVSVLMLSGGSMMSSRLCLTVLSYGLFAMNLESGLVFAVAVDRLLVLACAVRYSIWSQGRYVVAIVTPAFVYAAAVLSVGVAYVDETTVFCMPPTAYQQIARPVWFSSAVFIGLLVGVTYVVSYTIVRLRNDISTQSRSAQRADERRQKLMNSLMFVGMIYCVTWLFTMVTVFAVEALQPSPFWSFHVIVYVGWTANLNAGCNVFVYTWRSNEWRDAVWAVWCGAVRRPERTSESSKGSCRTVSARNEVRVETDTAAAESLLTSLQLSPAQPRKSMETTEV